MGIDKYESHGLRRAFAKLRKGLHSKVIELVGTFPPMQIQAGRNVHM